eukprot:gene1598-3087_t
MLSIVVFLCLALTSSSAWMLNGRSSFSHSHRLKMTSKRMEGKFFNRLVSIAIALPILSVVAPAFADAIPAVGTNAPDFVLSSNAGKSISLKDLAGKWTVLYFYPGDFTQGCTIEAKSFEQDIQKYKDLGVQIVGVSVDSVDKHLDFGKTYGLDFPLLSDQGGTISNKYGTLLDLGFIGKFSNRQTYIISPDSKVKYVFTDVESRVAKHSEDVLIKLKELI